MDAPNWLDIAAAVLTLAVLGCGVFVRFLTGWPNDPDAELRKERERHGT